MSDEEFYSGADRYDLERIASHHKKALKNGDKELIRDYIDWKMSTKHISSVRARKIAYSLIAWEYYMDKAFLRLKIEDVHHGITAMKDGKTIGGPRKGRALAQNTQRDMVKILKPFLRWLIKEKGSKIPLEKVVDREDGISAPKAQKTQITSSMILTVEEVLNTIKATRCRRDQALLSVLYESGCRIGELGRLQWKDAVFDEYGIKLYLSDRKVGQKRYYRLTMSRPALAALKDTIPGSPADTAYIFIDDKGERMKYKACDKILRTAAKKAGITKHVHLHLLRHSRATHMKAQGFSDSTIKKALWNNEKTDQWDTYVNLSEEDVDGEFLNMAGVSKEEKKAKIAEGLKPRICYYCGEESLSNAQFCWKCGSPLSKDARKEYDSADKQIEESELYQKAVEAAYQRLKAEMGKA
jgi:integrase/ribosomal protein L40E